MRNQITNLLVALPLVVFAGCGADGPAGESPASSKPAESSGSLPSLARAPEGQPVPRGESKAEETANKSDRQAETAAPSTGQPQFETTQDQVMRDPADRPRDDSEPYDLSNFPKPGALLPGDQEKEPADLVEAEAGVGAKGHYESQDVFSTAISARFRAEERILLGQVKQGLQMFRATHGRKPRSHEEFMTEVIDKGGYRLPELPEGQSYYFDPDEGPDGTLMVRRPKPN